MPGSKLKNKQTVAELTDTFVLFTERARCVISMLFKTPGERAQAVADTLSECGSWAKQDAMYAYKLLPSIDDDVSELLGRPGVEEGVGARVIGRAFEHMFAKGACKGFPEKILPVNAIHAKATEALKLALSDLKKEKEAAPKKEPTKTKKKQAEAPKPTKKVTVAEPAPPIEFDDEFDDDDDDDEEEEEDYEPEGDNEEAEAGFF